MAKLCFGYIWLLTVVVNITYDQFIFIDTKTWIVKLMHILLSKKKKIKDGMKIYEIKNKIKDIVQNF